MPGTRAFKHLAALRDSFVEAPAEELPVVTDLSARYADDPRRLGNDNEDLHPISKTLSMATSVRGKVDGRRERKVLKTPSVALSVSVRREIHEDVSAMLFAQKSTWIALLDELLQNYVQHAKSSGRFPR